MVRDIGDAGKEKWSGGVGKEAGRRGKGGETGSGGRELEEFRE